MSSVKWVKEKDILAIESSSADVDFILIALSADAFENSLEPDQARQNVWPDLDPNCLTLMVLLKEFLEKADFVNKSGDKKTKTRKKHPSMKRV